MLPFDMVRTRGSFDALFGWPEVWSGPSSTPRGLCVGGLVGWSVALNCPLDLSSKLCPLTLRFEISGTFAGDEAYAVLQYGAEHADVDGPGLAEVRAGAFLSPS